LSLNFPVARFVSLRQQQRKRTIRPTPELVNTSHQNIFQQFIKYLIYNEIYQKDFCDFVKNSVACVCRRLD
ncbi:hypothetical protein, partial [Parachitinimonas caeni]